MIGEELLTAGPYTGYEGESWRKARLLEGLCALTQHHQTHCPEYAKIVHGLWNAGSESSACRQLEDLPFLPVSLFKRMLLSSVPLESRTMTLTSSGTTGQQRSQITLDKETSLRQQRALAASVGDVIGDRRLPMLIADSEDVLSQRTNLSARGAGVLGMMRFGARPVFMLDSDGNLAEEAIDRFLDRFGHAPFFIFGFTFLVWKIFSSLASSDTRRFSNGKLLHSGGWKKMQEQAVDSDTFRSRLRTSHGLERVNDFYGMVEQIGTLFVEGDDHLLHPPAFGNVIIRDPVTWQPCPTGTPGLIQVQSLIPLSYPGHSLLTEDIGVIESRQGTPRFSTPGFRVLGRVKKAELRGCSDVIATTAEAV